MGPWREKRDLKDDQWSDQMGLLFPTKDSRVSPARFEDPWIQIREQLDLIDTDERSLGVLLEGGQVLDRRGIGGLVISLGAISVHLRVMIAA